MYSTKKQSQKIQQIHSREDGAVLIDATVILSFFFFLFFGIFEYARVLYIANTLEYVTDQTARFALLQTMQAGDVDLVSAIRREAREGAAFWGIDLEPRDIRVCAIRNADANFSGCRPPQHLESEAVTDTQLFDEAGAPNEIIVLRISKDLQMGLGLGQLTVRSHTFVKNEPAA